MQVRLLRAVEPVDGRGRKPWILPNNCGPTGGNRDRLADRIRIAVDLARDHDLHGRGVVIHDRRDHEIVELVPVQVLERSDELELERVLGRDVVDGHGGARGPWCARSDRPGTDRVGRGRNHDPDAGRMRPGRRPGREGLARVATPGDRDQQQGDCPRPGAHLAPVAPRTHRNLLICPEMFFSRDRATR